MEKRKMIYERPLLLTLNTRAAQGACTTVGSHPSGSGACGSGASASGGGSGNSCVRGVMPTLCSTGAGALG
jgi:hypothetical protein